MDSEETPSTESFDKKACISARCRRYSPWQDVSNYEWDSSFYNDSFSCLSIWKGFGFGAGFLSTFYLDFPVFYLLTLPVLFISLVYILFFNLQLYYNNKQ